MYIGARCRMPLSDLFEFWQNCAIHLSKVHSVLGTEILTLTESKIYKSTHEEYLLQYKVIGIPCDIVTITMD